MTTNRPSALHVAVLVLLAAPAVHAASDCQAIFDAYAAQAKVPAMQKTVTTPGMTDAVQLIVTQDVMFSRVGPNDAWTKNVIDDAMRKVMEKGAPTPETVNQCRLVGRQAAEGMAGTAYEFAPYQASGNVPGEMITVLIDDETGLPVSEKALKAGTVATIVYDGVSVPVQ
ncbi:hypothetical protein [Rhizobium glycinendophyticum]|uniref:Uncharacterized protein n=1 Tax=Rhizobium glycinendophyticum TaxID=2589807 RepID=A0A504U219_9HYPH|nr:hypothetical protein [Rhizobium glycinendophyticum]TPP03976.1 hypothetical protein FJQ55_23095 [Rhizobium glycinendophyticum]